MSALVWMEFSGNSTLCKKKWNTQEEVKEVHVKQNVPAPSSYLLKSRGYNHYLSRHAIAIKTQRHLCTVDYDKSLSEYPLHRNSTIEIRYRERVGQ
uniref:Uncharacterized protein n=1 Tax=Oryza glumipatula TaxID=40148 RepID=A0A0D9ZW78_9ORYZ